VTTLMHNSFTAIITIVIGIWAKFSKGAEPSLPEKYLDSA